jgi:hypothetical protein
MPPTSLVKFADRHDGNGRGRLYWNRADVDGYPYRGQSPPLLKEEEYAERVTRVADPLNRVFNILDPDDNRQYLDVLDKITNGWAQLVYIDRSIDPDHCNMRQEGPQKLIYVEWVEFFMEDGSTPVQMSGQGGMNGHGQ